jgi:hypothetical protein
MLRLVAFPVFLLVLTVPALAWFCEAGADGRARRTILRALLVLTLLQGALFQWQFHQSSRTPRRLHLFDAEYPQKILAAALATPLRPVYLADALAIPGYIQAYWYGTLQGIDLSQFVHLPAEVSPPTGAIVISTEENCPRCQIIATSNPYTLYIADEPARPRAPLPEEGFRAEIRLLSHPTKPRTKQKATLRVPVKNASGVVWLARERSGGPYQVSLGNHWLDGDGRMLVHDDGRSALLEDLKPGEVMELPLTINAPRKAGEYILELDMLQEGVSWFGLKGSPTLRLRLRIE